MILLNAETKNSDEDSCDKREKSLIDRDWYKKLRESKTDRKMSKKQRKKHKKRKYNKKRRYDEDYFESDYYNRYAAGERY